MVDAMGRVSGRPGKSKEDRHVGSRWIRSTLTGLATVALVGLSRCGGVFFSSRRRHTRFDCDWSSDVCSSDLTPPLLASLLFFGEDVDAPRRPQCVCVCVCVCVCACVVCVCCGVCCVSRVQWCGLDGKSVV